MIKLELSPKPDVLTEELQNRLTQQFIKTEEDVWNIKWLKEAIADKSFGKCCYSEISLGEESKYMEVEHFAPKSEHPELVMDWTNLNPSCKKCNVTKGEHDTMVDYIVNPFFDNPQDFLYLKGFRYYGKDEAGIGVNTKDILGLNDKRHFVLKRCSVACEIIETLEYIFENINLFISTPIKKRNHIRRLKNLMQKGDRHEEYSALVSTTILENNEYKALEEYLTNNNLWDDEFRDLKSELEYCALLPPSN